MAGGLGVDGLLDGFVAFAYEAFGLGSCAGTAGTGELRLEEGWEGTAMVGEGFDWMGADGVALVMSVRRYCQRMATRRCESAVVPTMEVVM